MPQESPRKKLKKKAHQQLKFDFMEEFSQPEKKSLSAGQTGDDWAGEFTGKAGSTVLDQLHQRMILFAAGRGEAMKRFLVEEGVGRNLLFWRLAQALSALYLAGTDEKRWVDGVLAREKGLGL
jgi:putative DNA methylase